MNIVMQSTQWHRGDAIWASRHLILLDIYCLFKSLSRITIKIPLKLCISDSLCWEHIAFPIQRVTMWIMFYYIKSSGDMYHQPFTRPKNYQISVTVYNNSKNKKYLSRCKQVILKLLAETQNKIREARLNQKLISRNVAWCKDRSPPLLAGASITVNLMVHNTKHPVIIRTLFYLQDKNKRLTNWIQEYLINFESHREMYIGW